MLDALRALGCGVVQGSGSTVGIHRARTASCRRRRPTLFLGNAGTAMRP
jgi:5-enolpyruvylshikimate-3-phosphate synthase